MSFKVNINFQGEADIHKDSTVVLHEDNRFLIVEIDLKTKWCEVTGTSYSGDSSPSV